MLGEMATRVGALEQAVAEDKAAMDGMLQVVEDTMPMEEALADRSFVQQLAARVHRLEEGAAPAKAVSDLQSQVDGLQRALSEQEHTHAATMADMRAKYQSNTRHGQTDTALQAVLSNQLKSLEEQTSAQLAQQVEQLRVTSEATSARCTDLSESVALWGRRIDTIESRMERKLAASTREVRVLSNRLQAELDSLALHASRSQSLAAANATISQFEERQATAVRAEPEPEPEPKAPFSAMLGTVASLEVEVAAQSKRLDAISLDLATRGLEAATCSRTISQSARSLAMRTDSEPAEAVEAMRMLRRSLRALEARVLELEDSAWKTSIDELPALVKDLIVQELANVSEVIRSSQAKADEERVLTADHQLSRLQSNVSALVERTAAQTEMRMSEIGRRLSAVEDQSHRLSLTINAGGGPSGDTAVVGQIEASTVSSVRATEQLAQVQKKVAELQVAVEGGSEHRKSIAEEIEKAFAAREEATHEQVGNIRHDLEYSIRSLEQRFEHCESAAARISALGREVDELRVCVAVEQQVRQQSAAVSAAGMLGTPPPSPVARLPIRAMSHQEIRQQLRTYKENKRQSNATSVNSGRTPAAGDGPF